jgi:protein-L-isoaspartate(D-aspartate) O-methyltransferase
MEPGDWAQAVIEFADLHSAGPQAAVHLLPALAGAQADGMIDRWFFIRKSPYWRLRYMPPSAAARQRLKRMLDDLKTQGHIIGWIQGIYEPEELAFGGAPGMETAHELFCADSHYVLERLARSAATRPGKPGLGERELGVLLPSVLMRGAEQDWYEQGDIWARVARHRLDDGHPLPVRSLVRLTTAVRQLMTVDASPASPLLSTGPLAPIAGWSAAFERAGQQIAGHARHGTLERGLRAVLAHHVLFHWNRLGLSHTDQAALSGLARDTVMAERSDPAVARPGSLD